MAVNFLRSWLYRPSSSPTATYTPLATNDITSASTSTSREHTGMPKISGIPLPGHVDAKNADIHAGGLPDSVVLAATPSEDELLGRLSLYERKSLLVNAELDRMGLGRYQICIWVLCGFGMLLVAHQSIRDLSDHVVCSNISQPRLHARLALGSSVWS